MLESFVNSKILPNLSRIPGWVEMGENKQAALISFAYNLGPGFYKGNNFDTITRALESKDWDKVPQALSLYVSPGTSVEAGLRRRREAEGKAWSGQALS